MPTRGASRGGLTGQLSMNDDLVHQLMLGSSAGPTKSFSVEQFAEMFKPPASGAAAGGATTASAAASSPRSRARRGSANATTSSGSGKTSEEIWKNIQLSGADSLQGPPSILPTPQGSGALGTLGTLTGKLPIPTGSMLFPQKSIERLVDENAGGAVRPATEWYDMMLASLPSVPKGLQPTNSARIALESAAERLVSEMDASPGRGARGAARVARGASLLGRINASRKDAIAAGAAGAKDAKQGAAGSKKRGRAALEADTERKPFTLPPKKKGRKKKGEIDTETEEEKQMRAEERQRKNRESAARSHRRKAELAGALEKRAVDAEAKAERLEKEVAKLKAEIAKLKRK
jgi:hypothetical protein